MTLPLFDPQPLPMSTDVHQCSSGDVLRTIEAKAGPFRELSEGKPTGREFRLVELHDGRVMWEFLNGERRPAPLACTRVLIDDAIAGGVFVEVRV